MRASRRSSEDPLKKRDRGKAEAEALLGLCGLCPHVILVGSVVWPPYLFVLYENNIHTCACVRAYRYMYIRSLLEPLRLPCTYIENCGGAV